MSALTDRLRGVLKPTGPGWSPDTAAPDHALLRAAAAEVLDGSWTEAGAHRYLVVDRTFLPGYRHGHATVADGLPPREGVWPRLSVLEIALTERPQAAPEDPPRLLFVDVETTGLAGGAGTYAFLIGFGWFDGGTFRTRQFFLPDYASERALLDALARTAAQTACVVSFNGKSFDLPLIETRFQFHRMDTPFADTPHLDMLHTARRLWQSDDDAARGCRLVDLEDALCGFRREGDVAGDQIPSRYFHFVRTGDARGLAPVFEHNRLDIVSLALLTARAAALLEAGAVAAATPREALGLGRLYQRAGLLDEALACFRRAAGIGSPPFADAPRHAGDLATRAQAVRAYAVACRRLRRFAEAASAWRTLLAIDGCAPALVHEAMEALAIHHEHRLRDVIAARGFALGSLGLGISQARQRAVHYRLARLERKHTVLVSNPSLF